MNTVENLRNRIEELRNEIRTYDYNAFKTELDKIIPFVKIPFVITKELHRIDTPFYQDPSIIFRARPNTNNSLKTTMKEPWWHVSEISIISQENKAKITFGRANKQYEPRFYACNSWSTACYETIWNEFPLNTKSNSKYFTVGVWQITEPLKLVLMPYSPYYIHKLKNQENKITQQIKNILKDERAFLIENIVKENKNFLYDIFILDFFTDEFAKQNINDEYDYFFTNYYCDQVFEKHFDENGVQDIDGIIYPSICFSYQNDNVVLHPRALNKIKFIEAMYVWVVYHENNGKTEYIPIHNPAKVTSDGSLYWELFK
ncbi:MAG: RES domain-containing protein [Bacteroidetes bacterium]|nr:RES domain-containing protein [Bacteroidota bacterium]